MNEHRGHQDYITKEERLSVVLVITLPPKERDQLHDREQEMIGLLDTAGCDVVALATQHLAKPINRSYIGKGKIEEVRQLCELHQADEVVFDVELSPSQARNLSKTITVPIIDYSALILHIFVQNARTHQAKLAVELAQLEYNRSRLKRLWDHLDRIKAGTNMRGPGEKQLETDKRLIDIRIQELKSKLAEIEERKERTITARKDAFKVALVGYTNAGKSSLMNALTDANTLAQDRLFATLDTRTTQLELDRLHNIVLSDTVGFIRKLPPTLISSFHATLAEVIEADLLIHVVDASLPSMEEQINSVEEVLSTIGADSVPTIMAFNKVDLHHSPTVLLAFKHHYKGSVAISTKTEDGLDLLRERILEHVRDKSSLLQVRYSISNGAVDAFLRRRATIIQETFTNEYAELVIEADEHLNAELHDNEALTITEVIIEADGTVLPKPERFSFEFNK